MHGLKNVVTRATPTWNFVVAGHKPVPTHRSLDPVSSYILLWEWTLVKRWATVFTKNSILPKFLMPCVLTLTAGYSKVLFSMENAQIMLEMAAKCSNYAKNSGLCFLFWIILFEADYAKNYASILYQCLLADKDGKKSTFQISLLKPSSSCRRPSPSWWSSQERNAELFLSYQSWERKINSRHYHLSLPDLL